MTVLTFDKNKSFSQFTNFMSDVKKELSKSEKMRPSLDYYSFGNAGPGAGYSRQMGHVPQYYINSYQFEHLAYQSDIFMTSINALRNKIFRRGIKVSESNLTEQINQLKQLMSKINDNNQTLKEVLKQFEQDLNIYDDGFLIALKDYEVDFFGEISSNTNEIVRASPTVMSAISDSEGRLGYTVEGEKVYVSINDRKNLITESQAEGMGFIDKEGIKLQPAHYVGVTYYKESQEEIYYIPDEVLHMSKHNPSLIGGKSPIYSIWMKMVTLIEQDRFLLLNYQKGRPPRGILSISTSNFASTAKAWENLKAETRKDPHSINPIIIEDKGEGKGAVEWVNLMEPLADMQFIESRNEMRRQIGAIYGVMPLFSGDLSQSGGLNNEGLQINVTNQAVEEGQKLYNEKVFPWFLRQFNITELNIQLEEPEEKDEVIEEKLRGIKIDNAVKMSQTGFDVSYNQETDEFSYSEQAVTPSDTFSPFGGQPKPTDISGIEKGQFLKKKDSFDIKKQDSLTDFIIKQLFKKTYDGLSKKLSEQINNILISGVKSDDTITTISKKIEKLGVDKQQAELITRTEKFVLKNSAREFEFKESDPKDEKLYKWIGPDDRRTTDLSKEIKKKSFKGLPLEELKKLVRKTSIKFGFKPDRDWFSHPNSRHTFVQKF